MRQRDQVLKATLASVMAVAATMVIADVSAVPDNPKQGEKCAGIAAAQLRVTQRGSDTVQTLYQTDYDEELFRDMPILEQGDVPVERYAKGIKVRIWVEKGLLFALTELP